MSIPFSILPTLESSPTLQAEIPGLTLVRYRNQRLPEGVVAGLSELPAHFDIQAVQPKGRYSLHTEYASKTRKFNSPALEGLDELKRSHRRGVPELWTSRHWAQEFAEFLFRLVGTSEAPTLVEVHPPFRGTVGGVADFLDTYRTFEKALLGRFPECQIVLENRAGTKHSSKFLVSEADSVLELGRTLAVSDLKLRLALDLAQLFTAHFGSKHRVGLEGVELLHQLLPVAGKIGCTHLWGRGPNGGAHAGDLDQLFHPDIDAKWQCLEVLQDLLKGYPSGLLVIETISKMGLDSIISDLQMAGFLARCR